MLKQWGQQRFPQEEKNWRLNGVPPEGPPLILLLTLSNLFVTMRKLFPGHHRLLNSPTNYILMKFFNQVRQSAYS